MPFTLRVEFTGLCLYVVQARAGAPTVNGFLEAEEVTVFMPRCRRGEVDPLHADKTNGSFHVGYLRFDLASLEGVPKPFPLSVADEVPDYEVVHRLAGQELAFGKAASPIYVRTNLPNLKRFAPTLRPRPELPRDDAGDLIVFRTTLTGGTLEGQEMREDWKFSALFNPSGQPYPGVFAEKVVWSRYVPDGSRIAAKLTEFGADQGQEISLVAVGPADQQTISLKLANLCCENPLGWKELKPRKVETEDEDFKWLYRLLEDDTGRSYEKMLGVNGTFPIPVQTSSGRGGQGCVGLYTVVTGA